MLRPRSLRAILAIYVVVFLIALLAVRSANYFVTHNALEQEIDRRLANEAAEIAAAGQGDRQAIIRHMAAEQQQHESADLYLMLADGWGHAIAGNLVLDPLPPEGYSDFGIEAKVPGVAHGRVLTRKLPTGETLVVVSDNDVVDSFDSLLFRVQLAGLGTTALIVIGGALAMLIAIGGRMRAMQRTVDAVIAGDLRSRIPLDGSRSEFDLQAAAFNKMLDRIDELMLSIKHAAKDVTHELKSPLARLRAKVAAIERHAEGNPLAPDITEAREQTDQILELFSSLMRLWEIEGGHRRERFADLDAGELAREAVETLEPVAEDAGQHLTIVAGRVPIRGDEHLLRQLLVNLIENAIRHTPEGTRIAVTVEVDGTSVSLTVTDNGPGIPPEQHANAIHRFGRLDPAGEIDGQGLGLTLVDAIARLHFGTLTLEDAAPGLRARVTLPLA